MVQLARRRAARKKLGLRRLELVFVGRRLQAIGLLIHGVGEPFGAFGEFLLRFTAHPFLFDFRAHFVERAHRAGLDAGQPDDVIAELRFDERAGFTLLHGEHRILEGLDHRAASETAEAAALRRRPRVLRKLGRQRGEIGARRLYLLQYVLGKRLQGRAIGLFLELDQNMAGLALLFLAIARQILFIKRLDLLLRRGQRRGDRIHAQHQILRLDLRRHREILLVGVIESAHRFRRHLDGRREGLGLDDVFLDLALLVLRARHHRLHRARGERGLGYTGAERLH